MHLNAEIAHVSIENVSHTFVSAAGKTVPAIDCVNFQIRRGEFVALLGPSGCGKSTILSVISGLLQPSEGAARINGQTISGIRNDVGYMLARDALYPWRTVQENVELALELRERSLRREVRRNRARELLGEVGLTGFEDQYPHTLSHGMRQRTALARTFAINSEIVLMDEPFSALDAQTRIKVQDLFLSIWEEHKRTVVLVTHDVAEAVALADRVLVFSARPGSIIRDYRIDIARPRSVERLIFDDAKFRAYMRDIWNDLKPTIDQASP